MSIVLHPWYWGVIILLWARALTPANLLTAIILSIYVVVGAFLEEKELITELGDPYKKYVMNVPMFIPRWSNLKKEFMRR